MAAIPQTTNYKFWQPPFNTRVWQDYINQNFAVMDAVLARFVAINNLRGVWANSTSYVVGDRVVDATDGTIYTCAIAHTSAVVGTVFSADRIAHPTFWTIFTFSVAFRGAWVSGRSYAVGDFVNFSKKLAVASTAHVAGADFTADQVAGKWTILVDGDSLTPAPVLDGTKPNRWIISDPTGFFFTLSPATCTVDSLGNLTATSLNLTGALTVGTPIPIASGGTNASTAVNARAQLGLSIGSAVQAWDVDLDAIAAIAGTGGVSKRTGVGTWALVTSGTFGETLLGSALVTDARTSLGLGTAALVNTGASGGTVPLLNALATFSAGLVITTAGLRVGAPTGGDMGAGSINTQSLFINGATIDGFANAYAHWREEQPSGSGATDTLVTGAYTTRTINTQKTNTITGASLSSSQITLPAGTFQVWGWSSAYNNTGGSAGFVTRLRNMTDSIDQLVSGTDLMPNSSVTPNTARAHFGGRFTIAAAKTFQVQSFVNHASGTILGGVGVASGSVCVYTEVFAVKVA